MNPKLQKNTCGTFQVNPLLRMELSAAHEEAFIEHLNSCDSCRARMESEAATPKEWREASELLKPSRFDAMDSNGDGDLLIDGQDRQPHQVRLVLDALGPTDDPEMLGRLGSYEVSGVVGAGGMGVVLKAIDKSLHRVVAIKVLAPHLAASGAARKRFAREAKAAAAVLHPNVIAIHSVSNDEMLPYLVMPYLRGRSLQKRLDEQGPLSTIEVLRIGAQVASGLAAAHAQGLVHRDIKPANILLEDGSERVTLTDFGLARAVDDASITHSGIIAGTPQYMSPEQARGEPVEQCSDLFSLGSVLYAISTGRPPFRADTTYGVMRRISDDEPTSIREVNPDIPDWLCKVIRKLMAKKVEDRYRTAGEVAELLEACLAHVQQPSAVPLPETLVSHRSSFGSNRKGVFAMLSVLGFSIMAIALWQTTEPPDIAGEWVSKDWGKVILKATEPHRYQGAISESTLAKRMERSGSGTLELKWSRFENRFNGLWKHEEDIAGRISLRLVDKQLHGAWTTNNKSDISGGVPRLSELILDRVNAAVDQSAKAGIDRTNPSAVAEAYVAAVLREDFAEAKSLAIGTASETATAQGISTKLNIKRLPMKLVYVNSLSKRDKAMAISETFVETTEADDILKKLIEDYVRVKRNVRTELDRLKKNPNLIWEDGNPRDPIGEKLSKTIGRVVEFDVVVENFEEKVTAMRAEMELLKGQLNDSDPRLIAAQTRLQKFERELERRREQVKKIEKQVEDERSMSTDGLRETLSKLGSEKSQYSQVIDSLKENLKHNQEAINAFLLNRADEDATKDLIGNLHVRREGLVDGCLLMNLSFDRDCWFVSNVTYTSSKEAFAELQKFLDANPNATSGLP